MHTPLRQLTRDLMEVARLGNRIGRELGRAIDPPPELTDTELRELRARAIPVELEVRLPDG